MKSLLCVLLLTVAAHADHDKGHQHKHKHDHKSEPKTAQKAHVHGAGTVTIAFDDKTGKLELELPAESLIGFEHKPKTKDEEKKVSEALSKLEASISKMVVFAPDLKCEIKKETLEVDYKTEGSGTHADVDGDFSVECDKAPAGSKVQLNMFQPWLKAKSIETQLLIDAIQKTFTHTKNGQIVELK